MKQQSFSTIIQQISLKHHFQSEDDATDEFEDNDQEDKDSEVEEGIEDAYDEMLECGGDMINIEDKIEEMRLMEEADNADDEKDDPEGKVEETEDNEDEDIENHEDDNQDFEEEDGEKQNVCCALI